MRGFVFSAIYCNHLLTYTITKGFLTGHTQDIKTHEVPVKEGDPSTPEVLHQGIGPPEAAAHSSGPFVDTVLSTHLHTPCPVSSCYDWSQNSRKVGSGHCGITSCGLRKDSSGKWLTSYTLVNLWQFCTN